MDTLCPKNQKGIHRMDTLCLKNRKGVHSMDTLLKNLIFIK